MNSAKATERCTPQLTFQIYNRDNGRYSEIRPSMDYTFEIISQNSRVHVLRVYNGGGQLIGDNFITANSNVEDNFIAAPVNEAIAVLEDMETVGDAPDTDCIVHGQTVDETQLDPDGNEVDLSPVGDVDLEGIPECQVEGTSEQWKANCEALYNEGIPEGALDFALNTLRLNASSFRTNQCWNSQGIKHSGHPSMMGLTEEEIESDMMAQGFQNKCQIVINDTDDRSPSANGDDCRGRMYYIDLCSGNTPQVTRDYFNIGTGSCRNNPYGFRNGVDLRTTVLGAFFTHTETFDFTHTTTQVSQYSRVRSVVNRLSDGDVNRASSIQLFGMQNTNNLASSTGKYMHVSPHRSSWGCPSISPENYHMIETLGANGPSLVVNYAEGQMEDIQACTE